MHKTTTVASISHPRRGSLFKECHIIPSPPIAFIGDSIMARFMVEGKQIWEERYAPLQAGNFGTIGESTQLIVEKLEKEFLALEETHAIVLMIGATDLRHRIKEKIVFDQIRKIIMLLQGSARPGVKILVLAILPRGDEKELNHAIKETNALISGIENGFTVRFLDLHNLYVEKGSGKIKQELFADDRINLSTKGFEVLADRIDSVLNEIIKSD